MRLGYAFSAQLRGAWYCSPGKTVTATGMETPLALKKPPLVFPIELGRRDPRVRQPIERDVVEDLVTRQFASRTRGPVQGRDDRRGGLAVGIDEEGDRLSALFVITNTSRTCIYEQARRRDLSRASGIGWGRWQTPVGIGTNQPPRIETGGVVYRDELQLPRTAIRKSVWGVRGADDDVTRRNNELSVAELKRRLSLLHDEHLRVRVPVQHRTLTGCAVDEDDRERHLAVLRPNPLMEAIRMGQVVEGYHYADCIFRIHARQCRGRGMPRQFPPPMRDPSPN
jgi:hypothetical protein